MSVSSPKYTQAIPPYRAVRAAWAGLKENYFIFVLAFTLFVQCLQMFINYPAFPQMMEMRKMLFSSLSPKTGSGSNRSLRTKATWPV